MATKTSYAVTRIQHMSSIGLSNYRQAYTYKGMASPCFKGKISMYSKLENTFINSDTKTLYLIEYCCCKRNNFICSKAGFS